jgi:hypothetical protein
MKRTPGVGLSKPRSSDPVNVAVREQNAFARRLRASGTMVSEISRLLVTPHLRAAAILSGAVTPSGAERVQLERLIETGE